MNKIKKIIFLILLSFIFATKAHTVIKDSLLATVGNIPITKSDIVNEMKILLILNNESYSDDKREWLYKRAMKTTIKRSLKQIAINQHSFLEYNKKDIEKELINLANNINVDLNTLKNICESNELDFEIIENQIKVELLWNSLIFQLYKNRLSINIDEINEQLKLIQNKKELNEYLISEIIIKPVAKDQLKSEIKELKNKIKIEGFENVAISLSISETASKGGNLGWINESIISEQFKSKIYNTPVGNLSEPILLPNGILIFEVRDKRKVKRNLNIEKEKDKIVNSEKTKILNMYSLSYYDQLKRTVTIKFYDE